MKYAILLCAPLGLWAQTEGPAFEAASVKVAGRPAPGPPADFGGPGSKSPTRVRWARVNLRTFVTRAYGLERDQVSGPDWIDSEWYELDATVAPDATKEQFLLMQQRLLKERFHLRVRLEKRRLPVYELMVTPGGPRLTKVDKAPPREPLPPGTPYMPAPVKNDADGYPILPAGKRDGRAAFQNGMVYQTWRNYSIADFALNLAIWIGVANGEGFADSVKNMARVVDKTGLDGEYDFRLEFAGDPRPAGARNTETADPGGPTLFEALEKQLGLKLTKGLGEPVDYLLIEHADKTPAEN